jgi:hypothetical protein
MTWRNCIASIKLAEEIDIRWPNRDHEEDGTIGDEAHASRKSDHNPFVKDANGVGVVRARDIDEDLDGNKANGPQDIRELRDFLLGLARSGDPRFKNGGYFISEGYLYSERTSWQPVVYHGANKHDKHFHVSFSLDAEGYDSDAPYGLLAKDQGLPTFRRGDEGYIIWFLAVLLNILSNAGLIVDENNKPIKDLLPIPEDQKLREAYLYSEDVSNHVKGFQRFLYNLWIFSGKKGPKPKIDGIFGPYTQGAIKFWVPIAQQKK